MDRPQSVFDKILSADNDDDETDDKPPLFQINVVVGALVSCSFDSTYFLQAHSVSYFQKLFLRAGFALMHTPQMPWCVYVKAPLYEALYTVLQSTPYKIRPCRVPSDHVYPLAHYLQDPSVLPAFSWV